MSITHTLSCAYDPHTTQRTRIVQVLSANELLRAFRSVRSEPVALDASGLDRILRHDASNRVIEVQASTRWDSLAVYLESTAPAILESVRNGSLTGSVGESVAANAPGPDGRPLVGLIRGLVLVTPDGELRRVTRESNGELFALAIGGHESFGVPYSITLDTELVQRSCAERIAPVVLEACVEIRGPGPQAGLLVPPGSLDQFLNQARHLAVDWRIEIRRIEIRPTFAEHETVLRWAKRDYAWVQFWLDTPSALGGGVRFMQMRGDLISASMAAGGSFPIGMISDASRAQVESCYPEMRHFLAQKCRHDPSGRLESAWYRHYRSLFRRDACDVRWSRSPAAVQPLLA